ncbi:polysaccharide deacetylase family protein [Oscillatoria sp. CS-180]|uniref:polysaccharide deacetylase family protein n=1 Tax=Oscillatoria sp. CS-180 TaxID=3021720 RepID=UPI002330D0BD|nr:polysaccharide deacetylase family protein [Oscillatoria sp. CS-180]
MNQVPVFMFHTIHYESFKEQLDYLKRNNYSTLSLREFLDFLKGKYQLTQPSVLLTFDDGEKSWYTTAFPLLKAYGFRAVGFVVPHYIQASPVEQTNTKNWLSWPELIEMDESGVFEIESHSYYHSRIFVSSKLVDFYHPGFPDALTLDVPWLEDQGRYTNTLSWGTPIYECAPRLKGQAQYRDSVKVRQACTDWVASQGGERFFENANWRKELLQQFHLAQENYASEKLEHYELDEQRKFHMLKDLTVSREILSEKLNRPVNHLCYPWGVGSEEAVSLSKIAGYSSNFWVSLDQRNSNLPDDSPYYIPRLKDDYLFRLPGDGRHSLWRIFRTKLKRRSKSLEIY